MIERYPFPESKMNKLLFGTFMLAMLYLTRDSMPAQTFLGFYTTQFLSLGIIAALAAVFLACRRADLKRILTDGRVILAVAFAAIILLPMIAKRDWQLMYFTILIGIYLGILLSYFSTSRDVSKYYVVIMTALAAYSVIGHLLLRPVYEAGLLPSRVFANSFGAEFLDYGLTFPTLYIYTKSRNYGLFREPGVYQFFLLLALYLTNYRVDWKHLRSYWAANIILAVTMMTTLATGGVIEMGLLAVVVFLDKKWYRNRIGRWVAAACVAGGTAILLFLYITKPPIYGELYLMMAKLFAGEDSVVDRLGSIAANMEFFFAHPLFGAKISDVLYAVDNNTSSTTVLFAILGILGGSCHILACAALVWDKDRFILWNLGLLGILMMSFNTQNFITNPFLWMIPIMALTERTVPMLNKGFSKWKKSC